jgi:hypothetical protein
VSFINTSGALRASHRLLLIFASLALVGCQKVAKSGDNRLNDSEHRYAAIAASKFDVFGKREFTVEDEKFWPIAYYRSFPKNAQRLLQHSDIESSYCRNHGFGNGLRACNRGEVWGHMLRQMGWCYTSHQHSGVTDHWMRCDDEGGISPDAANAESWYYNEADIKEAGEGEPTKLPCSIKRVKLPKAHSIAAARFDIFGKAEYSADDEKFSPASNYLVFPLSMRRILQLHDMERNKCWGNLDDVASLRACNRRNRSLTQIEARGWCWGSKDDHSSPVNWMKCSDIADYDPHQPKADSALYSLEDMRKAEAEDQARCL